MPKTRTLAVSLPTCLTLCCLAACGAVVDDSTPGQGAKGDSYSVASIDSICTVRVRNKGTLSVEEDYLPHVLFCEVGLYTDVSSPVQGSAQGELLKAQAIAARTFMHTRLTWTSSMAGTTDDQVYSGAHCRGAVPQAIVDAVRATRGLVLLKSGGALHAGYYRAGQSFTCHRYHNVYDEPCMGQREAAACASAGYSYQQILNTFYGTSSIVQTAGSCASAQGPVENTEPGACYFGTLKGSCQNTATAACGGRYVPDLCGGTGPSVQCCLPLEEGEGESCPIGDQVGTCHNTQFTSCQTGFQAGFCPGGDNVQCCLDGATPVTPTAPVQSDPPPARPEQPAPAPTPEQPVADPAPAPTGGFKWIGDPCTTNAECTVPGAWQGVCSAGFCSMSCDRFCPDLQPGPTVVTGPITRLIRPATFCASVGLPSGEGLCYARRDYTFNPDGGCLPGTTARLVDRTNQPGFKRNICVPDLLLGGKDDTEWVGESPSVEGDALDFKEGAGGCSLSAAPGAGASLPWWTLLLALTLLGRRRRTRSRR